MIKKTPLNDVHHKLEGQLTDFGGWEMPLWYKAGPEEVRQLIQDGYREYASK